jgi:isopentenyl-diphosphate delta-isomerase
MAEQLILVDENNRVTGSAGKTRVHRKGLLHRAFSIFLVDGRGCILLQQRQADKYHSGGLWANSCCGHPRPGERTLPAAQRRLHEELGVTAPLNFGFFARYRAELGGGMQENEFVYIYFGKLNGVPRPDPAEVSNTDLVSLGELARRVKREPGAYAYWLKHYLHAHYPEIARLSKSNARNGDDNAS